MKKELTHEICRRMNPYLTKEQNQLLESVLKQAFIDFKFPEKTEESADKDFEQNAEMIHLFISAKKIEGCSDKTLKYYSNTLTNMLNTIQKSVCLIETNDLRCYLSDYQKKNQTGKVTLDNIRRIMSSFFAWLEDEDYIIKSPVRRIRKVKTTQIVKETFSDEHLEKLRDQCRHCRDLAIVDLLISTGIRVGELVKLNRSDLNLNERECVVLGKGDKERKVYYDAKAKIHLQHYLESRTDTNPALFVALQAPWNRLSISGVERFLTKLGLQSQVGHVHPHKFRRTMATMAIEKGMPIEQVQKLLGHTKIDTTLHYAIVNQTSVKNAYRRYIG